MQELANVSPSSLDSAALARRLGELAGDERRVQADFLLHLEVFDRQRAYLDAGYSSLWEYCLKVLHLREGAAGRRIAAMRVLRRFPVLEGALREGKLCLSTLGLLGPVLTEENMSEVVERAAFRTRAEVDRLVAAMQPRAAPRDGIRKLSAPRQAGPGEAATGQDRPADLGGVLDDARPETGSSVEGEAQRALHDAQEALPSAADVLQFLPAQAAPAPVGSAQSMLIEQPSTHSGRPRSEVRPVSDETYSLRITLDGAFKGELDQLRQLLSHKVPNGDLAAVLREAVRCAIEKHGKRRGAVAPARKAPATPAGGAVALANQASAANQPASDPRNARPAIPAAVRREVWARDGGRCAWRGDDGRRCESRWQLEFDHVVPVALGGPTTTANLRLACRAHNTFHAEKVFGREHMAHFRGEASRQGESAIASGGER